MNIYIKRTIQWAAVITGVLLGAFVGRFIAKEILPNMGANMITPGDIIGCYVGSIFIIGAAAVFFSWVYLEEKL